MEYIFESNNVNDYLERTDVIDFDNSNIVELYNSLNEGSISKLDYIKKAYEFVRDKISHSYDIGSFAVTCSASEVLLNGTGICFAKSHLLAALLRKNGIPCGFCYQLLRLEGDNSPLILHGLNAVYLAEYYKWLRLDVRGNKEGVDTQFDVGRERLAFRVCPELGEIDFPYIFINPDKNVVNSLKGNNTLKELWDNLPQNLAFKL